MFKFSIKNTLNFKCFASVLLLSISRIPMHVYIQRNSTVLILVLFIHCSVKMKKKIGMTNDKQKYAF